jgi:class 3 adenylate cyclase/pimeloyl-ACP methyl ester carboxylesterase
MTTEVRYCTTRDGVRIAYSVQGEGVPILVCPGFVESFSMDDLEPGQVEFLRALGKGRQLIRFDMRGTGLSQRRPVDFSSLAVTHDLDAVTKAVGARRFYIWASTLSGPRAIQFAADHPRQVLGLMLYSTFARATDVISAEAIRGMAHFARTNLDLAVSAVIGSNLDPGNVDASHRAGEAYRRSADGDTIADMLTVGSEVDVTPSLARVQCRTLVLHRVDDTVVPFSVSQDLASKIPRATLAPLPGNIHAYSFGDQAPILEAVDSFLAGAPARPAPQKRQNATVRTILFTDLVGHTEMMRRLGDAGGRAILRAHESITRRLLKDHDGAEVKTMGDGFMASFGSVTKAMDCAIALQRAFATHSDEMQEPLDVRVGLNAGEPIDEDGDLFGSTVILASRVCAQAAGGEILIPEPVRHLLSGKNYVYADRGEVMLKGFEDAVRLFEVRWRA